MGATLKSKWIGSIAALSALVVLAAPAQTYAESTDTAPPAGPTIAPVSPTRLAAAHTALQVIFMDTGAVSYSAQESFRIISPRTLAQIMQTPFYASLTAPHQHALSTAFDGLPQVLADEAVAGMPDVLDEYSPRLAAVLNEDELGDITRFFSTPEGRSLFMRGLREGIHQGAGVADPDAGSAPTDAENQAYASFAQTRGGQAFEAHRTEIQPLLAQIGQAATSQPRVVARMKRELCTAVANQCPPEWRQ
jgi:hypothetical protein